MFSSHFNMKILSLQIHILLEKITWENVCVRRNEYEISCRLFSFLKESQTDMKMEQTEFEIGNWGKNEIERLTQP